MKIQITGRHVDVTDSLNNFAEEKVSTLSKFSQKILKIHVLLSVQNNIHHKCEMHLEGKGMSLNAHADSKNMYETIGKCVDKLAKQLRSHKNSYSDKNHRTATKTFENSIIEAENAAIEEFI